MAKRLKAPSLCVCSALWLGTAGALSLASPPVHAQGGVKLEPDRPRSLKARVLPPHFPERPSIAPSWSIPIDPLGFGSPGALYLGQRNSMASLDFIGEDRLLFTFHVPALLHRDGEDGDERRIRAVVLALPAGTVQAESEWTVHDRGQYLWMLPDGHFLVRNGDQLLEGDATLALQPVLRFPGPVLWLKLDPTGQNLLADSSEPVQKAAEPGAGSSPSDSDSGDEDSKDAAPEFVVRVMRRQSGQVMLVSRARSLIRLPINSDGYLETLRGRAGEWTLDLAYFTGGSRVVGSLQSVCVPSADFISEREVLATVCSENGADEMVALSMDGQNLWADLSADRLVWPLLTMAPDGLRFIRETLGISHTINAFAPLGSDDIKGQLVRVFNAANGELAFEAPASPILDAGGNAAISPSGRRVALLSGGSIQVFELPAAPPLPPAVGDGTGR